MRYFSVYDLVIDQASRNGNTKEDMYNQLRSLGVKKADLIQFQDCGIIPEEEQILEGILKYLGMSSRIELELALGRIPKGYEKAYFEKIKEIAKLIQDNNDQILKDYMTAHNIKPYYSTEYGILYNGDCLEVLKAIPNESVDCVFADPPFNLDKEYDDGVNDSKPYSSYINWCMEWLDDCIRVLKPGGSLFIYNIPKWHTFLSNYLNERLNFWNWIAVDMKFNLPIQNRLYPAHYSLLYYVKGKKPKTFNSQRIPLQTCRHCGGELKDYGGYKNKMNPNGVNVSDVWTDIYPVRHSNSKNRKYNQLPVKLLDRVITMSTNEGDVVLDPFGGSGTTYAVCELLKRRWIGVEYGNCEIIKERLENKENDIELLNRVYEEKNKLFPDKVKELRRKNGFWLSEDFVYQEKKRKQNEIEQIKLL